MSFIQDYAIYASGNEASPTFHQWCGLYTLAAAVSRRVWVSQGRFPLYPNLYVVLVGDPASGKTTAMSFAKRLHRDLQNASSTKHPASSPAAITKEALTKLMGDPSSPCQQTYMSDGKAVEFCHISIFANELVTLLGDRPNIMIDFLVDVYDQEVFDVSTKNKGTDLIRGPFVHLLGCMTPQTVDSLAKQRLITGGLTRRCNFIYATKGAQPVPRPQFTPEQNAAYQRCLARGKSVAKLHGEFKWQKDAEDYFDAWYHKKHVIMTNAQSLALQGYYRSLDQMLLRIAMLCSLSETDELLITPKYLEQALGILNGLELYLDKTFSGTGRNELASVTDRMLQYLSNSTTPVARTKLAGLFWSDATSMEFDTCVKHLSSIGRIQIQTKPVRGGGGFVEFISLTPAEPPRPSDTGSPQSSDPAPTIDLSSVPLT